MDEKIDIEKCKKCGGKCCKIYVSILEGGIRPLDLWFDEWCENWDEEFVNSKASDAMEPQFNPLEVWMIGNEQMLEELKFRGINPEFCKYHSASGCLLPRENRPIICREYMCKS